MKYRNILILLLFLTNQANAQDFKPTYQSNDSLDFNDFLGGVKHAYVPISEETEQFYIDNPSKLHKSALYGLVNYLKSIGFKDVRYGTTANIENIPSFCDVVIVKPSFRWKFSRFTEIELKFSSCNSDEFVFSTQKKICILSNLSSSFYHTYMKMYGHKKTPYSTDNRLTIPSNMTRWSEEKLKKHFKDQGADSIEGIHESIIETTINLKYKIGIVKDSVGYEIIYLSGASNYMDWKAGELKAKLYTTVKPSLYKSDWYMADKEVNENSYMTIENGLMTFFILGNDKILYKYDEALYVKLYPNSNRTAEKPNTSYGTGFALSENGLIATNQHVIDGAKTIKVRGINGDFIKSYNAKLIVEDKKNDLAIIKIDDEDFSSLGNIPFVISEKSSEVGSSIFVMGYPLRTTMGDEIKLTNGIISSKSGFQDDVTTYQISAPVQPGSSGGPLFDIKGNLIGIIRSKHTKAENVSYAIKASYLLILKDSMPIVPKLQKVNSLSRKALTEQVKTLKKVTYIIEVDLD